MNYATLIHIFADSVASKLCSDILYQKNRREQAIGEICMLSPTIKKIGEPIFLMYLAYECSTTNVK